MFTSRAEHRLHLREDNADERLTAYGYRLGLVSEPQYACFREKYRRVAQERKRLAQWQVPAGKLPYENLRKRGSTTLEYLLKVPGVVYDSLGQFDGQFVPVEMPTGEIVEIQIKYQGYLQRQLAEIERFRQHETIRIPDSFSYLDLVGLRREAREKFDRIRPHSLGQAARIPGITCADVALLMVHLKARRGAEPPTAS
jgi:tRNA uridine 5-carboxymethylaminomethyl modification enzyme